MRYKFASLVFLACAALGASGCKKETPPAPDSTAEFHGTWRTVPPTKKEHEVLIKFENEVLYLMDLGGRSSGSSGSGAATAVGAAGAGLQRGEKDRYAIVAGQKLIDFIVAEGENEGKTRQGIYSFEGDQLKICLADYGQERPTEFVAKFRTVLWVLERKK